MSTPPNMLQLFQQPAEQTAEYAAGFSEMVQHLIEQDAANQNAYLEQLGSPQQIESANIGDTLNAFGGFFPATAMNDSAQSWQAFANALPGLQSAQLGQSASLHAQELANQRSLASMQMDHARQMAAADMAAASSGGGEAGGLTPYQAASLEMRALEFQTEQGRYAQQDELDWLKFEAELEQDEMERQERENTAAADALLYQGVIMLAAGEDPFKNKKYMAALNQALGMGSASAAGALTGAATGASEDAADAKADAIGRRTDKREDIRSIIASQFGGLEPGMNKQNAVSTIMGAISTQYPKFAGWKPDRVRNMVRQHVNSQWDNYRAGSKPSGGGGGGVPEVRTQISSAFDDFTQGLDTPTVDQNFMRRYRNVAGYRSAMASKAVNAISGSIRDSMTRSQWKRNRPRILKMVRNYVRRNRRHFKVTPRPRPASSGGGGGGVDLGK